MTDKDQMSVAEFLIARLKECGLPRIFGVPGGGSSMDLIDAARRADIPFVLTRREDSGAIMAATTAWLSGGPGLALGTKGPGLTSAANGIASACLDRAPVVFVSDGFGANERSYVTHQYFDQIALMEPITKHTSKLDGDDPASEIETLIATMTQPPKGPAYIELTGGTARHLVEAADHHAAPNARTAAADDSDIEKAIKLINAAKRPVVVAGLEALAGDNATAVRGLTEALNAPALVTYMGKGVIPDAHPNFAGIFTGGAVEQACVNEADLIILAGLDPVELIRQPWPYSVPVLDIAEVQHEPHYMSPEQGLYGSVAGSIERLTDSLQASDWSTPEIAGHLEHFSAAMEYKQRPSLTPVEVVSMASETFGSKPRLAVDAGAHMFSAVAFWPANDPYDVLISNGLATMAFALPAGLAAALHDPDRGAVAMTGDGGLMMCLGELVTAAQQKANLTVIVFNDGSLSLIDIKRQEMQLPELGFNWQQPDFAAAARGFGCTAWRVADADSYQEALTAATATEGPCLIDVVLDPEGYLDQMRSLRG
ncbi:MAG: hypothetical protein GKS00_21760 [Alphaproteobacteria bacterium]|nr:hypothetical protein [Alphaproteobacteria bacterium]